MPIQCDEKSDPLTIIENHDALEEQMGAIMCAMPFGH